MPSKKIRFQPQLYNTCEHFNGYVLIEKKKIILHMVTLMQVSILLKKIISIFFYLTEVKTGRLIRYLKIDYQTKSSSKWAPIRLNASIVLTALIHLFLMTYRFNLILQIGFSRATSSQRCSKSWPADGLFLEQNNGSSFRLLLSRSIQSEIIYILIFS